MRYLQVKYMYEFGPIDGPFEICSFLSEVEAMIKTRGDNQDCGDHLIGRIKDVVEQSLAILERHGKLGTLRNEPIIIPIPNPLAATFEPIVFIKLDNNGTGYLFSHIPIQHLKRYRISIYRESKQEAA